MQLLPLQRRLSGRITPGAAAAPGRQMRGRCSAAAPFCKAFSQAALLLSLQV